MMNRKTFIVSSSAVLLTVFLRANPKNARFSDEAIREILHRRISRQKRATGMAVGLIEDGKQRVIVHGHLDDADSAVIAADTLFEIGSVTKVFTALLLAEMVQRNVLKLDDPVEQHLPAGFRVPQRNGRVITLAQLAGHTSALPFFPFNPVTTPNPLEALARFSYDDLRAWLADFTLPRDPGAAWEYSNVGYGLLGLALATKAGSSFDKLLYARIIKPLGLKDTTFHPSGSAATRLAVGHDPQLRVVPPINLGIFAPAGGLHSTTQELLTFLIAMLPGSGSTVEAPAQSLLTRRTPAPAAGGEQALGWDVITTSDPFVAKDGVTVGQTATVALDIPKRTGVVVLSNAFPVQLGLPPGGGVGAADLARHLMRPALPID